jgi:serine/threonine-protein kinase ULK4
MILETEVPAIPGFSSEFNDLVSKLLKKDPIERITWPELKRHPFWTA